MRFTTFVSLSALLGLAAACGGSSDAMSSEQPMQVQHVDLKGSGPSTLPEEDGSFEDRVEPRSDLKTEDATELGTPSPAPGRIRPAAIGDARMQADDLDEIEPEEGEESANEEIIDETTPGDNPGR